jgi:thiol:disulfide interchange protein
MDARHGERASKSSGQRYILLGVAVLMTVAWWVSRRATGPLPTPANWLTDFTAALEQAGREGRPVLLDFGAAWCPPCQAMARNVLPDARVAEALKGFIAVKLDADREAELARRFRAGAIPVYVVLDAAGREVHRFEGYRDAAEFAAEIAIARTRLPASRPTG